MPVVRFFAAAAEVVGNSQVDVSAGTVAELRAQLAESYGLSANKVISRCSVLVNGVRAESGDVVLIASDLVDVLPPFAGG